MLMVVANLHEGRVDPCHEWSDSIYSPYSSVWHGVAGGMLVAPMAAHKKVGSSSGGDGSMSGTSTANLSSCGQCDGVHVR